MLRRQAPPPLDSEPIDRGDTDFTMLSRARDNQPRTERTSRHPAETRYLRAVEHERTIHIDQETWMAGSSHSLQVCRNRKTWSMTCIACGLSPPKGREARWKGAQWMAGWT